MTTVSSGVTQALVARINTVKQAAGYALDIIKTFYPLNAFENQIMGMDLQPQDMPAVILYQGQVKNEPQHHLNSFFATYYLELVQPWVPDDAMWEMVGALGKAIWGGAHDAIENSAYRFHPNVVEVKIEDVVPDFGMLQSHRIWVVVLMVHYRVRYTNI